MDTLLSPSGVRPGKLRACGYDINDYSVNSIPAAPGDSLDTMSEVSLDLTRPNGYRNLRPLAQPARH